MSAQLASVTTFSAHLALADGVTVSINAPTFGALGAIVERLQAANDSPAAAAAPGKSKPAATAAGTSAATPTAAPSAAAAPAPAAGDAGNASTPAASPPASTASSSAASGSSEVSFDSLKKAFLGLSTKAGGRALCEGVLRPYGLAKLSEAKPEQYAAILKAIEEAAK